MDVKFSREVWKKNAYTWFEKYQELKAAQHRMHWTALWVGLGSFVLGFATCAIILALL